MRKFALMGAMLLGLSSPAHAAICPASLLANVSGQNSVALQTFIEKICANLDTIAAGGLGGGGGAVTEADGANVTLGAKADPKSIATDTTAVTAMSVLKQISASEQLGATAANQSTANSSLSTIATNTTGAATAANQSTSNTSLSTIATNTTSIATAANQTTANSSLSTIATNTTAYTEDAAAAANPIGRMMMAVRQDTLDPATVTADNDNVALRATASGELHVNDDEAIALLTTIAGATGGTQYSEDAAAASNPVGTILMGVRRDTLTVSEVTADNDNVALKMTSKGEAYTHDTDLLAAVQGVAHDAVDTTTPSTIGQQAIAHGTNPTAVAAGDVTRLYANRAGVPFVIGGHPNVITRSAYIQASDGAQTNASILTISTGSKIVITQFSIVASGANTVNVDVKLGFGTATLPASSVSGAAGILADLRKVQAGSGIAEGGGSGIIGIGADNEDVRVTCDSPTSGAITITFSYYTIES